MDKIIFSRGNYKTLLTYKKADVIFQMTSFFCRRFLNRNDRTVDQIVQAARSGKQNIVEGNEALPTSMESAIKLINVAKASLKELLEDYEDFLKTRGYRQWESESKEYSVMRQLGREHSDSEYFMRLIETRPPETIANMAIILLNQADYLLFRQLCRLEKDFLEQGGFKERMYALRRKQRGF